MNHQATESEITPVLRDFESFCNYLCDNPVTLTATAALLGKKDLYALNSLMANPKPVAGPVYQQPSYPLLHLFFHLAAAGKLFRKELDSKGKIILKSTTALDEFRELNSFEKYVFLLQTYWLELNLAKLYQGASWYPLDIAISGALKELVRLKPGQTISAQHASFEKQTDLDRRFLSIGGFLDHLSNFGLWNYQATLDQQYKNYLVAMSLRPTALGIDIVKVLLAKPLENWNNPLRGEFGKARLSQTKLDSFFKAFEPLFPRGVLQKTVDVAAVAAATKKRGSQVLIFKVSLSNKIWRKIKISSENTLEDLHDTIQRAFCFDNDHLYSFFMDGKRYSDDCYNSPYHEDGPYADETRIGELDLYPGQRILYFFDYGNCWEFTVRLEEIRDNESLLRPEIIAEKGEAPEQYPAWD